MHLALATFAYPNVQGRARAELLGNFRRGNEPADAFVLSTCLRVEVAAHGSVSRLREVLEELFGTTPVLDAAEIRTGEKAATHLFRVAAGLESAIVGEPEILVQFRQALADAKDHGVRDTMLVRLLEGAVSTGRQARQVLGATPHDSMGAVAAQAVGPADRVAVLGAGVMGRAVVGGLHGLPAPPSVTVLVRSPEKVGIPGAEVWSFDRVSEVLSEFPAVVSATSASTRLLNDDQFAHLLTERTSPLTLVDMAMPPDFTPPTGADIIYYDIDQLATMAGRRPRSMEADELVGAAASERYRQLADHLAVGPLVGGLVRSADAVVSKVVERFQGKLSSDADRDVLAQAAHTVARTLLAGPISHVRSPERGDDAIELLADAFGIETTAQ